MNKSLWQDTVNIPEREALARDISADVCVIGGGLAGVLTAYYLKEAGLHTVLLEADRIGGGQTGNTTAKVTSQHNVIYKKIADYYGMERARQYAEANEAAIAAYRTLISEKGIDCEWEEISTWLYTSHSPDLLKKEAETAKDCGIAVHRSIEMPVPFECVEAMRFDGQAQFHPLKFMKAIAADLEIYEHTRVLNVDGGRVHTPTGDVTAKYVVFCTHFPFVNKPGYYFLRMHQERSYVLALEGADDVQDAFLGIDDNGLSLRRSGDLLLLGGGSHRTGNDREGGKYELLKRAADTFFPGRKERYRWSAQDCMTDDGIPYIGAFADSAPGWYVATGFGKWGMTNAMAAAHIIRDLIVKGESPWQEVYAPARFSLPGNAAGLLADSLATVKGFAGRLSIPRETAEGLTPGHGGIVILDGEKVGVYKTPDGEIFAVHNRCPHLGCELSWNPDELSWDCPCHGSRFDYTGALICGPAQEDISL